MENYGNMPFIYIFTVWLNWREIQNSNLKNTTCSYVPKVVSTLCIHHLEIISEPVVKDALHN